MAYGGGYWLPPIQNKTMPGTYMYFSSKARPTNIFGDRGYAAFAMELSWGEENQIITVENADLQKESMQLFGLEYNDERLLPLREALLNAHTIYTYNLKSGGKKASGTTDDGTLKLIAKYPGTVGNDIKVTIGKNIDNEDRYDVQIKIKEVLVYEKTVDDLKGLEDNRFINFSGAVALTPGITLKGGQDGTTTVTSHTKFLELLEAKYINIVAYAGKDDSIKRLYNSYVTRRVAQEGAYFQGVLYDFKANSELIINVKTPAKRDKAAEDTAELVYFVAGLEAGCAINRTCGSRIYNGELVLSVEKKQRDLENSIKSGEFVFHEVDKELRVLADINSFTDFEVYKNEDFSKNQTMRVLHQIGNDWSAIFNKYYLDKVQNDDIGRTVLWNDFHNHLTKLGQLRAITNFESDDLKVELGDTKESVYAQVLICPVFAMNKLYVNVMVE